MKLYEFKSQREAARLAENAGPMRSASTCPPHAEPALGHQNEKDRIYHPEHGCERYVREFSDRPVVKCGGRVRQFVDRADENQIGIPAQVTTRYQHIGDADHQHKRSQQGDITSERRQLVFDAQRGESLRRAEGKYDTEEDVVSGGDRKEPTVILFPGGYHAISFRQSYW